MSLDILRQTVEVKESKVWPGQYDLVDKDGHFVFANTSGASLFRMLIRHIVDLDARVAELESRQVLVDGDETGEKPANFA